MVSISTTYRISFTIICDNYERYPMINFILMFYMFYTCLIDYIFCTGYRKIVLVINIYTCILVNKD